MRADVRELDLRHTVLDGRADDGEVGIQLLSGTYEPQPVQRVEIDKPEGGVPGHSGGQSIVWQRNNYFARPTECIGSSTSRTLAIEFAVPVTAAG
jgi:hypothetical protein